MDIWAFVPLYYNILFWLTYKKKNQTLHMYEQKTE